MQGIVFRRGDESFAGAASPEAAVAAALADARCVMVNRNAGSGTRILIDLLLAGAKPQGYWAQPKSHGAVAAAVAQGRADWGVAINTVADLYDLGFLPLLTEHYDLVVPQARRERAPVRRLIDLLRSDAGRAMLRRLGFEPAASPDEQSV
jgi:putative molybdopterin biosynthesis protein